ncbi:MAG: cytochrome b5-like heme/steroid binding domain-containing protein [Burkholderiales bacterium]
MKKTVLAATIAFWCFMIGAVVAGNLLSPDGKTTQSAPPIRVAQAPAMKQYSLKEVAAHAAVNDCWMAIGGKVYDFSAYISQHPAAPAVMTRHCGKEATRAFETKDRDRPHSDYARSLLGKYLIGTMRE